MPEKLLILSSTISTPELIIDPAGSIKLSGKLISENPVGFFSTVRKWIETCFNNQSEITDVEVALEYINSAGVKLLLDLIDMINQRNLMNNKKKININWYSEGYDEDIFDKGSMISSVLNVPFNFIKVTG